MEKNKKGKQKIVLKGIVASPGIVQGRVRLIKSPKDILAAKKEEIIITPFLNPDFITLLKKNGQIKGIVTNEGGATCHAAILAREFKIPYIAGAEKATKMFKNNMDIILDGEKGTVYET